MSGFVKVYETILRSSIWLEDDHTRLVWLTMLVLAGPDGIIRASIGGLAHQARVPREACERAISVLLSPDADDQSKIEDGRRIVEVEGGWLLVNHGRYREMRTSTQMATAARVQKHRVTRNDVSVTRNDVTSCNVVKRLVRTEAEAEAEAKTKAKTKEEDPAPVDPNEYREIICPLDFTPHPTAVAELAGWAKVSENVILAARDEFLTYWTIGAGAGKRRSNWQSKFREHVRRLHRAGRLGEVMTAGDNPFADELWVRALAGEFGPKTARNCAAGRIGKARLAEWYESEWPAIRNRRQAVQPTTTLAVTLADVVAKATDQ